jgi:hypothetical protein
MRVAGLAALIVVLAGCQTGPPEGSPADPMAPTAIEWTASGPEAGAYLAASFEAQSQCIFEYRFQGRAENVPVYHALGLRLPDSPEEWTWGFGIPSGQVQLASQRLDVSVPGAVWVATGTQPITAGPDESFKAVMTLHALDSGWFSFVCDTAVEVEVRNAARVRTIMPGGFDSGGSIQASPGGFVLARADTEAKSTFLFFGCYFPFQGATGSYNLTANFPSGTTHAELAGPDIISIYSTSDAGAGYVQVQGAGTDSIVLLETLEFQ